MADNTTEILTPIIKIQQNGVPESYDLGATFENVYLGIDNNNKLIKYTLKDFYDELVEYFNTGDFILYSDNEPTDLHVKVWYNTNVTD